MSNGNYWLRSSVTRRRLLRTATIGAAGLAGAALIGCGGDDEDAPAPSGGGGGATGTGTAAAGGGGAPAVAGAEALERAPGFPGPAFGAVPINTKPRIMGGTLNMPGGARALGGREMDPDVAGFFAPAEYVNDRLVYPQGWTEELHFDVLESFEWVSDAELLLRIRPGIKSHNRPPTNGRIVDAEDIAYSINRKAGVLDPEAAQRYPRRTQLVGLERADAVDDVTVRMNLKSANASILAAFGDIRQGMQLRELDDWDFVDMTTFPGFGPWMVTEDVDSVQATFVAHPDYYRSDAEGGRPSFEKMVIQAYPDRAAQLAAFITGETDHLASVATHEDAQVKSSVPDALRYLSPSATITHVNINPNTVPAFQDQRVRKAWHYVRDFKEIGDPISAPGWQYSGPFHPMHEFARSSEEIKALPGFNPDTKAQDIAEAQKMMAAAGYPEGEGIAFKIWSAGAVGRNFESGERVRNQLVNAFPKMAVELDPAADIATFNRRLNEHSWEALGHDFAQAPDLALNGMTYYHSTGGRNYAPLKEAWIDEGIEKILQTLDPDERRQHVRDFEDEWFDWGPPFLNNAVVMTDHAMQANIGGVDLVAGTWTYFYTLGYGGLQRWFWRTE